MPAPPPPLPPPAAGGGGGGGAGVGSWACKFQFLLISFQVWKGFKIFLKCVLPPRMKHLVETVLLSPLQQIIWMLARTSFWMEVETFMRSGKNQDNKSTR